MGKEGTDGKLSIQKHEAFLRQHAGQLLQKHHDNIEQTEAALSHSVRELQQVQQQEQSKVEQKKRQLRAQYDQTVAELEQQFQKKVKALQRRMHEELALQQAASEASITAAAKVLSDKLMQQGDEQQQGRQQQARWRLTADVDAATPRKPELLTAPHEDTSTARRAAVIAARAAAAAPGPSGRASQRNPFTGRPDSFSIPGSSSGGKSSGRKQRPASYMERAMQAAYFTDEEAGSDGDGDNPQPTASSPARSTGSAAGPPELGWFQRVEDWEASAAGPGRASASKGAADCRGQGSQGYGEAGLISRSSRGQVAAVQRKGSVTFADMQGAGGMAVGRQSSRNGSRAGVLDYSGGGVAGSGVARAWTGPAAVAPGAAEVVKRKAPRVIDLLAGESDNE